MTQSSDFQHFLTPGGDAPQLAARRPVLTAIAALLISSAVSAPAFAIDTSTDGDRIAFDVTFVTHLDAGMVEQDVYVQDPSAPHQVWRPATKEYGADLPLFAAAAAQPHNPADSSAKGPYPTGSDLDLTLGEWLGASGSGQYSVEDGKGRLQIEFEDLVPNGVYTIWHFFMVNGATDRFIGTFDLPVGALDGSQSVFVADADGSATFDQTFDTALQLSGAQLTAGLALNWHSDGQTYGVLPGAFGESAHIQLFTALPSEADF